MTQLVNEVLHTDDGSKVFFTMKQGKIHEGAAFFWLVHNKDGEILGTAHRGFSTGCEAKENFKAIFKVAAVAALNKLAA